MGSVRDALSRLTTGKKSAWLVLVVAVLLAGGVMGMAPSGDSGRSAPDSLPAEAESTQVAALLEEFPGGDAVPAVAVIERADGLNETDREWLADISQQWSDLTGRDVSAPIPAEDGQAALVVIEVDASVSGLDLTDVVADLREAAAEPPSGLTVQLTGGAAFAADISSAFDGANFRLLAVTAAVVALLLILTYRSPVLWLVPLVVIALADRTAAVVTEIIGGWTGDGLDGSTSGITSVLVFGAGTNYALLLVSRYREELRRHEHHRDALAAAVRGSSTAIVASNLTVVLALLMLLFSVAPNSQALGLSAAVGLIVAVLFALFVLPAALSLFGRGLFWPFIPRNGAEESENGGWFRVARAVTRRPVPVLVVAALVLGVLASGLAGAKIGLSQTDQFRVQAESVDGLETLSEHFPAGAGDPVTILVPSDRVDDTLVAIAGVEGVEMANPQDSHGDLTRISATLADGPATPESIESIKTLRADLAQFDALVGGSVAKDLDSREGAERDLMLLVPLILAVILLVLFVIMRSILTPVVLITINLVSTLAALGLGTWVSNQIFGFPALDVNTPTYAFLFLVALGIDYTVFLVLRCREETERHGTVDAMVRAVGLTGGVITSAGIVLASVFVVLGVLPLITLTQVGVIVGLGILLDTFFVRTVVVPAVFALAGDRIWWPSKVSSHGDAVDTRATVS